MSFYERDVQGKHPRSYKKRCLFRGFSRKLQKLIAILRVSDIANYFRLHKSRKCFHCAPDRRLRGGESGGMKALISFVMQVMFGWCHVSSCWEISMAEQAGGPNVPITQRCDYPVCLCSDGCVLACVLTERKACLSVWVDLSVLPGSPLPSITAFLHFCTICTLVELKLI